MCEFAHHNRLVHAKLKPLFLYELKSPLNHNSYNIQRIFKLIITLI